MIFCNVLAFLYQCYVVYICLPYQTVSASWESPGFVHVYAD